MNSEQWAEGFRNGDPSTFAEAYKGSIGERIRRHAMHNGCDEATAEDIVSTAIIQVYANLQKDIYKEQGDFEAYVFGIAKHKIKEFHRGKWRKVGFNETQLQDGFYQAQLEISNWESRSAMQRQLLSELLDHLSDRNRKVFELKYMGNMNVAQISEKVGLSMSNVKAILDRGRKKLAKISKEIIGSSKKNIF